MFSIADPKARQAFKLVTFIQRNNFHGKHRTEILPDLVRPDKMTIASNNSCKNLEGVSEWNVFLAFQRRILPAVYYARFDPAACILQNENLPVQEYYFKKRSIDNETPTFTTSQGMNPRILKILGPIHGSP